METKDTADMEDVLVMSMIDKALVKIVDDLDKIATELDDLPTDGWINQPSFLLHLRTRIRLIKAAAVIVEEAR